MKNGTKNAFLQQHLEQIVVFLFFLGYLMIGLHIYDDYGVSFDEDFSRRRGILNYNYVLKRGDSEQLLQYPEKYHGPAFAMLLVLIEDKLPAHSSRTLFLVRHLATFLFFYVSVLFFYFLGKKRFQSRRAGLLGCLFLILSPRIFADSFYNPKDLVFLSMFIISVYTMIVFLEKKTWLWAIFHAVASGILIDIRLLGVLIPCLTGLLFLGDLVFRSQRSALWKELISLLVYSLVGIGAIILFFPALWEAPVHHFVQAFVKMKQFPWPGSVLYLGEYIKATHLPWHYLPVWILITTPLLYSTAFFPGLCVTVISLITGVFHRNFHREQQIDFICLAWLFLPILMVITLRSVIYDGWRHLFFVYPACLLIAVNGIVSIWTFVNTRLTGWTRKTVRIILYAGILLGVLHPLYFMIRHHPHQNVYFNRLAGENMRVIKENFDLDYWGLSFRQAFEYITSHDPRERIHIFSGGWTINAKILAESDQERIVFVNHIHEADYFVGNYRTHKEDYPYKNEVFSIEIDDAKIIVVYKFEVNHERKRI